MYRAMDDDGTVRPVWQSELSFLRPRVALPFLAFPPGWRVESSEDCEAYLDRFVAVLSEPSGIHVVVRPQQRPQY